MKFLIGLISLVCLIVSTADACHRRPEVVRTREGKLLLVERFGLFGRKASIVELKPLPEKVPAPEKKTEAPKK